MTLGNVDLAILVWFATVAVSAAYVAWDAFRYNPEYLVMKWGCVLVTLYTGVFGACFYVLSSKEPRPGTHKAFVRPMWKQALGSTIHCAAGDATGVIVAAALIRLLGYPMWVAMAVEYALGFGFGLLVFQALFMRSMMGGTYLENLKGTFVSELLSMNAMMGGMLLVMALGMTNDMRAMYPQSPHFWFVMSLATLAGILVAYPVALEMAQMESTKEPEPRSRPWPSASRTTRPPRSLSSPMPASPSLGALPFPRPRPTCTSRATWRR